MVSARYPIETWSRPQLEDHFHNVVEELQSAQKKVKEQEKQILTFNTRFRRNLLERKTRDEKTVERSKYEDVLKENQILDMKLKAAKHQLLIYTAPSARANTASLMTGRSTFRQPPSTFRQFRPPQGSIDRPPSAPVARKKSDADKLQLATDEKLTIVRLNRTLKSKNDEIAELKFTIEKLKQLRSNSSAPPSRQSTSSSSKKSSNNNNDDEDDELSEMSEMTDSERSVTPVVTPTKRKEPKEDVPRNQNQSQNQKLEKILSDKLRIAESDLQMIKEECELVKKANERLINQSLSKSTEYGARESIEEKKKIVELEEQLKETEKRIRESEHRRREDQKKFEAMRVHYKAKYDGLKAEKKTVHVQNVRRIEDERPASPPPITFEPSRKRQSQSELSKMRRADDDLLQKLYREVSDILETHDVTDVIARDPENSLGRWQKLYAELYEELEKVRNMLVVQYDINQKQTVEIKVLKDELERLKTVSAEIIGKTKEDVEEKQKKIFALEEQIRIIAYSGQKPVTLLDKDNKISIPTPSLNTDLSVKLIHVKPSPSLTSKFFFSMEFFDFQLETTPILDAKQQSLDFTTVYDVLVSNLLIHYLQTNGVTIEMYKPWNDTFQLIAVATISLIPLFEENVLQKFCSEIALKSVENGTEMCTLRYEIQVSQPISDGFQKFKRSESARNMMPLKLETSEDEQFEPITIMVNRIQGLETLGRNESSEFCVVYEFLSFSPFFTEFTTSSEIRSKRDFLIPKTESARGLFASSHISFFLIENIPKQDGVVATLHLPLQPLCKLGGSIKGTFPMTDPDGKTSTVLLDIGLIWKHEIPSFFLKVEPEMRKSEVLKADKPTVLPLPTVPSAPTVPPTVPPKEEKDTPILPAPRRSSKQFDVTPVKENEPILRDIPSGSPAIIPVDSPKLSPELVFPRSFSDSSSETSFSTNSRDAFALPERNEPMVFDFPSVNEVNAENEEEQKIEFDDDDEEIESVSAKSSHRDPPEVPEEDVTPRKPSEVVGTSEELSREEQEEVEEADLIKSQETTPITQRSLEAESPEDVELKQKTDEIKEMLGALPPIAKPRNIQVGPLNLNAEQEKKTNVNPTGRIVFTDPLHYSVPPSESSSTSSPRRAEKPPVPLPEYDGHSLIKRPKPLSPTDKDVVEPDMKVTIQLEEFELVPGSSYTPLTREDTKFFVDWCFLDFVNEQSKSAVFQFPTRPQENVQIAFSKEYILTRGQLSLLAQWIQASVKFELTVIKLSPGDEEELGFGSIMLVPNNSQNKSIVIEIFDRNGIVQAELQMSIQFSRALIEQLN